MNVVEEKYRRSVEYFKVFSELITAAKYHGVLIYKDIAKIMNLPETGQHMGAETGHLLGEISEHEHNQIPRRPMLSALVVKVDIGIPGEGFFVLARQLGRLKENATKEQEKEFWANELNQIYDTWSSQLSIAMTTILHLSDMHDWDGNTLECLGGLAKSRSDVDVAAVTGDCFVSNHKQLPYSWNAWPQRLKLSVPGNHDGERTFNLLHSWNHTAPYVCLHGWDEKQEPYVVRHKWDRLESYISHPHDITFVGLDASKDLRTGKLPKASNAS